MIPRCSSTFVVSAAANVVVYPDYLSQSFVISRGSSTTTRAKLVAVVDYVLYR